MIQLFPQPSNFDPNPPEIQYVDKKYIESLTEIKLKGLWQLNMVSGDKITIKLEQFIKFRLM